MPNDDDNRLEPTGRPGEYFYRFTAEEVAKLRYKGWLVPAPAGVVYRLKMTDLYDGLTGEECLARYEAIQREDFSLGTLTEGQKTAAREEWTARLRRGK